CHTPIPRIATATAAKRARPSTARHARQCPAPRRPRPPPPSTPASSAPETSLRSPTSRRTWKRPPARSSAPSRRRTSPGR
ncbi:MAG: hypothetical protein AVDCRST_MAG59-3493, partial [uncultured Thermomicrobiales bacterium]